MSPEVEAQKVIAISLGKIASSRVQRGGPKLRKNLLVANLIHKARTLVDDQFHCYYPSYEQIPPASSAPSENTDSTPDVDKSDLTEVTCEDEDMTSGAMEDRPNRTSELDRLVPTEYDDKENDSPQVSADSASEIPKNQIISRTRSDSTSAGRGFPSRCLKRRNSCSERKADYDTHRSPSKRVRDHRRISESTDVSVLSQDGCESETDGMDVEQISTLVSAFSNSFRDFSSVSYDSEVQDKSKEHGSLWRSSSVPDMVLCAQQATSVLKMRQQGFETSTPVLA